MVKASNNIPTKIKSVDFPIYNKDRSLIKVVIYLCWSSKDLFDENYSIQSQKEQIFEHIKKKFDFSLEQIEIIEYIDEKNSDSNQERTRLLQLLSEILKTKIDYIFVAQINRLADNFSELQRIILKFESKNIKFVSVKEKIDTESTNGKFFLSILDSLAHLEKSQMMNDVQDAFKRYLGTKSAGGATPFGYLYSYVKEGEFTAYTEENSSLYNLPPIKVFDKTNDEIFPGTYAKYIFDWFISYSSISKVAKRLNDLLIPIPRVIQENVKLYQSKKETLERTPKFIIIDQPGFWSRTTVRDIILNPFYTGIRVWNRYDQKNKIVSETSNWLFINNAHEKIIDEKTYVTVTALYDEIKKKTKDF